MKFSKILLWINLFFLQSYLFRFSLGPIPTNAQELLVGLSFLVFIVEIIREKGFLSVFKHWYKYWILLSFLALTLISVVVVHPPMNVDFIRAVRFLLVSVVFVFMFFEVFHLKADQKKALYVTGFGAIFFGIFSVIYNLAGLNVTYDYRLQGPLDSAVYLSYYLTPFFIFFAIEFLNDTSKKSNLLHAILLAFLVLFTRSMGSVVVAVLVLFFYILKRSDIELLRSRMVKSLFAGLLILVLGLTFYVKILPTFTTNNTSLGEREEIWKTTYVLLSEPRNFLFGLGYGQFQTQYAAHVDKVLGHKPLDYIILQPHNIFLLFMVQYGVLGLVFLFICIFFAVHKFIFLSKDKSYEMTLCLMLLYFILHGFIDTPFFKNDLLILLMLFLVGVLSDLFPLKKFISK